MKFKAINLESKAAGSVELSDEIFGLEPRGDILHRVVRWQLAKRQADTEMLADHCQAGSPAVSFFCLFDPREAPQNLLTSTRF